jgi:two-component system chemotaxis response regulator CheY
MNLEIKVLVVDDFSTMRRIVKNALKQIGFKSIVEADDGTTALDVLKQEEIGLVVSDWNMPQMSGLDLLKKVRGDEATKNTPFVMVTAESQKDNVLEAVQAGVSNYVVKPFTPDKLEEKLKEVLDK